MADYVRSPAHGQVKIDLPPISSCACCGYSLAGHADHGRCPECGVEYFPDDCGLVFAGTYYRRRMPWLALSAVPLLVILWKDPALPPVFLALFPLAVLLGWLIYRGQFCERVALKPDGIAYYRENGLAFVLPWKDVEKVRLIGGRLRGYALSVRVNYDFWARVVRLGRNKESARRFAEHAQEYYRAAVE